jgi:hypothetical protein
MFCCKDNTCHSLRLGRIHRQTTVVEFLKTHVFLVLLNESKNLLEMQLEELLLVSCLYFNLYDLFASLSSSLSPTNSLPTLT